MQAALVMMVTSWMSPLDSLVKSNTNCAHGRRARLRRGPRTLLPCDPAERLFATLKSKGSR